MLGLYPTFIARQHAMHAMRDIVVTIPPVRPSDAGTVSAKRMYISSLFYDSLVAASF